MKIVFFGTPEFAAKTLEYLIDQGLEVVAVVTKPDKPQGRSGRPLPTPVKEMAREKIPDIPVFQPQKASSSEFIHTLSNYPADVFVVVAYGEIIKQELIDMPKLACLNVHASLLPQYRGAAPIQRAIMEGRKETGVTIMHIVRKLDAGPMIKQAKVKIGPNMTAGELHDILQQAGAEVLVQVLEEMEQGPVEEISQDENLATYAKKIEQEDCEIHWELPARRLFNLIRGTSPFPGAWCRVWIKGEERRMKILEARVVQGYTETPGNLLEYGNDGIIVACGDESLRLIKVKLEGKKAMTAEEFARGVPQQDVRLIRL